MAYSSVGISAIALGLPSIRLTNDDHREHYPDLFATLEESNLAKFFSLDDFTPTNEYELEMIPYLNDPVRGIVEQRVLGPEESSLTLEYRAAVNALAAARLSPNDIDLLLVASFLPEQIGFGNAAILARQLGISCAAWNLDPTISAPIALQTACALVQTGEYRNALVVISCTYSRIFDKNDTFSWFFSDGAGAMIVNSLKPTQGILGSKTVNTSVLCDQFPLLLTLDEQGNPLFRMQVLKSTNKVIGETAAQLLLTCCLGAIAAANVTLDQIDFFIFKTPTAWFANFCARVLEVDLERTINIHYLYANIGSTLSLANLYHAAQLGKIHENDLVLIYDFGVASSASATVMRWGDVAVSHIVEDFKS